jgi:hypothetical protein
MKTFKEVGMNRVNHHCSASVAVTLMLAGLLAWPAASLAQLGGLSPTPTTNTSPAVVGDASAVRATVLGFLGTATTTVLADTGSLGGTNDARDASQLTGNVPSLLGAETLSAATIGWPDEVDSEASLTSLNLTVAGIGISADSVMSRASSMLGSAGSGSSTITGLSINGTPVGVTGDPNQTVAIPGGQLIINEQQVSPSGITVNALHVIVNGVADMVIASATAGIS